MTDQEKADLELSLALIDQAASSDDITKANKDLKDAVNIEVDASLNLTDSKEKVTDQMSDLEYTLYEQNRAEKRYLNTLDRRIEIERKIGLVDYSQIDKKLHDQIVDELEKRLKAEQEKNKKQEDDTEEEEETETRRKKSDSEYLREAEKFHKKQKGLFQKISESHKNYMQTSSSFLGRLAMGAMGKGTSELMSAIDSATDAIPGARTAKQVGGFVRDQWRASKEEKRQKKIQSTAKILRAKDEAPESEEREEQARDDHQRRSTEGILGMGVTLGKILEFLKKMMESMMIMGLLKTLMGAMGSMVGNLAGLISSGVMAALTAFGLKGLLGGIVNAVTNGLKGLAGALKLKIPGLETDVPDGPDGEKKKTPEPKDKPDGKKKPKKPPKPKGGGRWGKLWSRIGSLFGAGGETAASRGSLATISRIGAGAAGTAATGAAAMLYSSEAGAGSADVSKFDDPEVRAKAQEGARLRELQGWASEYKDSYGEKPLLDDKGNVIYYPNPEKDKDIDVENERRFKFATDNHISGNSEKEFRELTATANEIERIKQDKENAGRQTLVNSMGQQNTVNNINGSTQNTPQFGFSPYEYSSRDRYSRGEIK